VTPEKKVGQKTILVRAVIVANHW